MKELIKDIFTSPKEENRILQLIRTITVLLLVLAFQGAMVYVMISSLFEY